VYRDCRKSPVTTKLEFPILIKNVEPFLGMTFIFPLDAIMKVFLVSTRIFPVMPSSEAFFDARTFSSQPMNGKKLLLGYLFTIALHRVLS